MTTNEISFEEYCKLRNIDVNILNEEQYDDLWLDYFFDIEAKQ